MLQKEVVEIIPLLANASELVKEQIREKGRILTFKKGDIIFREREEVEMFYFVLSGYTVLFRYNYSGERKIVFVFGQGAFLNEVIVEKNISSISAETLSDVMLLGIPRNVFLKLLDDPKFARAVIESASRKIRRLYRQMANTPRGFKLEKQVASKLWKLGNDFGVETEEGTKIAFPLSVTFLADMVGGKRESVSRITKRLRERGIIVTSKNYFIIKNMDELIEIIAKN